MLGALGCRSARDNQIDLLERELRTQEDYIYELEDYVLEYSEKLRRMRGSQPYQIMTQERPLEPELMPSKQADKHPIEEPVAQLPEPELPEPEPEPEPETLLPEELDIPELEFETTEPVGQLEEFEEDLQVEATSSGDLESDDESIFYQDDAIELALTADESLSDEPDLGSEAQFVEKLFEEEESPDLGSRDAERLVIIGAYQGDPSEATSLQTGPTSLLTVIEARDANDEPVDLDGKISLMIMTANPVSPQRLKRWDFSAEETASAWQSSHLGDGLHLELPLEGSVEFDEPLELWVRLVGEDGRKLLAQLPLDWEQLVSVEVAMETQPEAISEERQLAEVNARPLPHEELATQPSIKEGPQWRASLRQTHFSADGYATTAQAAQGWTAQPAGGREPLVRSAAASQSVTPANSTAFPREKYPQWSPPRRR